MALKTSKEIGLAIGYFKTFCRLTLDNCRNGNPAPQDLINGGDRINTPGTGFPNWEWKWTV